MALHLFCRYEQSVKRPVTAKLVIHHLQSAPPPPPPPIDRKRWGGMIRRCPGSSFVHLYSKRLADPTNMGGRPCCLTWLTGEKKKCNRSHKVYTSAPVVAASWIRWSVFVVEGVSATSASAKREDFTVLASNPYMDEWNSGSEQRIKALLLSRRLKRTMTFDLFFH